MVTKRQETLHRKLSASMSPPQSPGPHQAPTSPTSPNWSQSPPYTPLTSRDPRLEPRANEPELDQWTSLLEKAQRKQARGGARLLARA
jgi:hypothetical protein